jgi:hypothetical protein
MATVTFDTLKYVETLTQAGVPEAHARAFAEAERLVQTTSDIATKADISDLRQELRELELRVGARFERVDARFERIQGDMRLLKWMLGVVVTGIVALVMKAFLHG